MHIVHPPAGARPAPTPEIPDYLQRVFDHPDLLHRATEIADVLADVPEDRALAGLALLSEQYGGWAGKLFDAAGYMLLHRTEYQLSAPPVELRAAA